MRDLANGEVDVSISVTAVAVGPLPLGKGLNWYEVPRRHMRFKLDATRALQQ